jgi:hypothetical protein
MDRPTLPAPMSANDIYMLDMCISLRILADAAIAPVPLPVATPDALTALREPATAPTTKRKAVSRDDIQAETRGG